MIYRNIISQSDSMFSYVLKVVVVKVMMVWVVEEHGSRSGLRLLHKSFCSEICRSTSFEMWKHSSYHPFFLCWFQNKMFKSRGIHFKDNSSWLRFNRARGKNCLRSWFEKCMSSYSYHYRYKPLKVITHKSRLRLVFSYSGGSICRRMSSLKCVLLSINYPSLNWRGILIDQ